MFHIFHKKAHKTEIIPANYYEQKWNRLQEYECKTVEKIKILVNEIKTAEEVKSCFSPFYSHLSSEKNINHYEQEEKNIQKLKNTLETTCNKYDNIQKELIDFRLSHGNEIRFSNFSMYSFQGQSSHEIIRDIINNK